MSYIQYIYLFPKIFFLFLWIELVSLFLCLFKLWLLSLHIFKIQTYLRHVSPTCSTLHLFIYLLEKYTYKLHQIYWVISLFSNYEMTIDHHFFFFFYELRIKESLDTQAMCNINTHYTLIVTNENELLHTWYFVNYIPTVGRYG